MTDNHTKNGFTLLEVILVVLLLGILGFVAVLKWPTDLPREAAVKDVKRAIRYSQHMALTREFTDAASAWGIVFSGNRYTIQRYSGETAVPPDGAAYPRSLPGNTAITEGSIYFNGYGEPIDPVSGLPKPATTFTINSSPITICPQTGYVARGASCP